MRALISTGRSIVSSYIQLQLLDFLLLQRSLARRYSAAGKKKDLRFGGEDDDDCLSSSNTLCESVDSIFFVVLFDIFFHDFLLPVRRLIFCVCFFHSRNFQLDLLPENVCCSCVGVFFLCLARHASSDITFSSSALKTSCDARLQVEFSCCFVRRVVGEVDTKRGLRVGEEESMKHNENST